MESPGPLGAAYYSAVDEIYHARWLARRLARIRRLRSLIARLWPDGHPAKLIVVGGTSGKGSTSRYIEAGLKLKARVGTYTGPHVYDYRERFTVDGAMPDPELLARLWRDELRDTVAQEANAEPAGDLRFYEISLLMAMLLFAEAGADWGIVEVGIGGRYDNSQALDPAITALTNVGSDHADVLGKALWQRAWDKGGLARKGAPLFTTARGNETLATLSEACDSSGSQLEQVGVQEAATVSDLLEHVAPEDRPPGALLAGQHQLENAALALAVVQRAAPQVDAIEAVGQMALVTMPGRFQVEGGVIGDIAHSREEIEALIAALGERMPERKTKTFVVGLSGDRGAADVLAPIMDVADAVVVTSPAFRGVPAEALAAELREMNPRDVPIAVVSDPREALNSARKARTDESDLIVVTGSAYVLGEALNPDEKLRYLDSTYGWRLEQPVS